MDNNFKDYQLRCELRGHEDDVLGICVCGNAGIATCSQDGTVRLWTVDPSDERRYAQGKVLRGHKGFVDTVMWIEPTEEYPEGRIVSGGMDTVLLVWDLKSGEMVQTLKGHQLQVTGIAVDNGDIVSSSLDNTLKRWRNGQLVESWEAHKSAIQAVIKLPSGELVTGSSDTTLKLWKGTTCTQTFVGHTGMVGGLAMMPELGVLSASHDGSIRLWDLTGKVLMELVGHISFVYAVDRHASGLLVSSSNDCFAKIWKGGVCIQSLEHPGCVWDSKFLEDGDIMTACSDGVIRIWTVNQDKVADAQDLKQYFSQLTQEIIRKRVSRKRLNDLPGLEVLKIPGTIADEKKIVREGNNAVEHAWNIREEKWHKIGSVDLQEDGVKCLDESANVPHVDIGDGNPKIKLPRSAAETMGGTASCHQNTSSSASQFEANSQIHSRSSSASLKRHELGQSMDVQSTNRVRRSAFLSASRALKREADQKGSDSSLESEEYKNDPLYDLDEEVVNSGHELDIPRYLSYDVSEKQEAIPIQAVNDIDSIILPEGFQYINQMRVADNVMQPKDYVGCSCRSRCMGKSCPCFQFNGPTAGEYVTDIVFECGKNCTCGSNCPLRNCQAMLEYPLELYRTQNKGWAVKTLSSIPKNVPVREYLGLLRKSSDDGDSNETTFYLMDIDCLQVMKKRGTKSDDIPGLRALKIDEISDGPEFTVDAAIYGNITRFINHSCDPNLTVRSVTNVHKDVIEALKQARLVFFTNREIKSNEELTIAYDYEIDALRDENGNIIKIYCHCGASNCRGRLI